MLYLIHACPDRRWYVEEFLIPSMLDQGISSSYIEVFMDSNNKGNLFACMDAFASCKGCEGATWHLQDDVIISRDFYTKTKAQRKDSIVCGFCGVEIGPNPENYGSVRSWEMWWSFQCILIPNDIASECADWFYYDAMKRGKESFDERIGKGKSDDWFFKRFIRECHPYIETINLKPNIVDHVDYLLGGSIVNKARKKDHTSAYFNDRDLVEKLEDDLSRKRLSSLFNPSRD